MKTTRYWHVLLLGSLLLGSHARAESGFAIVDAEWINNGNTFYNTLVSWDGSFITDRDSSKPVYITSTYRSRWGDDGSVPTISNSAYAVLNKEWATAQALKMLNSWPWSPTWPNGLPNPKDPPMAFTIEFADQDNNNGARYALFVEVRKWSGITSPVSCSVSTASISIGPVSKDAIASSSASVSLRCNADTNYKMTVGSANGGDLVPYTSGGKVRMSFDGGTGQRPNISTGHAEKNLPVQTNVRATTVPGTALPGTYTASAVVSIEIL